MNQPTWEELRARAGAMGTRYAGVAGTGPVGKTCRDCRHLASTGNGKYYKCGLTNFTHGDATTIKVRTPACEHFAHRPVGEEIGRHTYDRRKAERERVEKLRASEGSA